uniref:Arachidonate 15-lipoxygenase B-like n=1 Tax=Acanthochromis polyacanthus TaxID=80966 RepID=A0A3Q1G8W1_9TELE
MRVFDDTHHLGRYSRQQELKQREEDYRWHVYVEGLPHCIEAKDPSSLPCEVRFSFTKTTEFAFTASTGLTELALKGLTLSKKQWTSIDAISRVFCNKRTPISEYAQKHWKEDAFFGYQYLNGVNPILIRRCKVLPRNFPITVDKIFLHSHCKLTDEMQKGNIYLCDYKRLDGLEANTINGKKQYLMAPLVLTSFVLHLQLKQNPADDNPIFYPTDSEYDWLMAKIFVRSADFSEHQLNVHLLRTHLLAEVFAVSLLRNVPMIHPLYKVTAADEPQSFGVHLFTLLNGAEDVPNYYYRDDGLKLWDGILGHYYKSDAEVQQDTELQKWTSDIFEHGFLSQANTGIPQSLTTVAKMVKFVTMVIFTGSGQHSAVNTGQVRWPNLLLGLGGNYFFTQGQSSFYDCSHQVALGQYPEDHFSEEVPCKMIQSFQGELEVLTAVIKARNKGLEVPYTYMDPKEVENSVAI